jgi:hypothetical protein
MRQVVDGPGGQRFVLAAEPIPDGRARATAELLTGHEFLPDQRWRVRVSGAGGTNVFEAASEVIAERLVLLLGEELALGVWAPGHAA